MGLEGRLGEGSTTVEGYRSARVKYPSDGQFSGRARRKEGRSRERGERKIGCSMKEKEKENCLLIRPDNCRWVSVHLVSNHLDLTLPRTLLIVLFIALCFAVLNFYLALRSLLLFMRRDVSRMIMQIYYH